MANARPAIPATTSPSPAAPAPKCLNCLMPVDPLHFHMIQQDKNYQANTVSETKLQTLHYLIGGSRQVLQESLNGLQPHEKVACAKCTEFLAKIIDARRRFRSATADGSVSHKLQLPVLDQSQKQQESVLTPPPDIPVEQSNNSQSPSIPGASSKRVTGNGKEISNHTQQTNKKSPASAVPTDSKLSKPPPLVPDDAYYKDWRKAYGVAKLIMTALLRPNCKKQTKRDLNDYILEQDPEFFKKNEEPNVIDRVLKQYFFNSTQHGLIKHNRPESRPLSEIQGSLALWTIHNKYKDLETIRKRLEELHGPKLESPKKTIGKRCSSQEPQEEASSVDRPLVPVPSPNKKPKSDEPNSTDTKDDGAGSSSDQNAVKSANENKLVTQKVATVPQEAMESSIAIAAPQTTVLAVQRGLESLYKTIQELIQKLELEDKQFESVERMAQLAKSIYLSLDDFLIKKTVSTKPIALTNLQLFATDVLAEYFQCLMMCVEFLANKPIPKFSTGLDLIKLRLIRVICFQLQAKLKQQESNTTTVTVALTDTYLMNIANCLKWTSARTESGVAAPREVKADWSDERALRVWALVLQRLHEKHTDQEYSLDLFAVNLDHTQLGHRGFREKLEKLKVALEKGQKKPIADKKQ